MGARGAGRVVPSGRRAGSPPGSPRPPADPDATPEGIALARADDERATSALRSLPPRHRQLLGMLTAEPPMSYDQISDALAMPRGSIGPTRARILHSLRRSMLADAS